MTHVTGNDVEVSRLAALLERQVDRYERLRALSEEQSKLVEAADPEQLLGVLSRRQVLVDEAASIDRELAPYRQRWEKVRAMMDEPMRVKIGSLVEKVREHLSVIVAQDDADRSRLEAAKVRVSEQLGQTRHVGAAISAYGGSAGGGGTSAARMTNRQA